MANIIKSTAAFPDIRQQQAVSIRWAWTGAIGSAILLAAFSSKGPYWAIILMVLFVGSLINLVKTLISLRKFSHLFIIIASIWFLWDPSWIGGIVIFCFLIYALRAHLPKGDQFEASANDELYGDARWGSPTDLAKGRRGKGLVLPAEGGQGFVLGGHLVESTVLSKRNSSGLMRMIGAGRLNTSHSMQQIGLSDQGHVVLVGGARSAKGTDFIIPNIYYFEGSQVILDHKSGENFLRTAYYRAQIKGQKVQLIDPFGTIERESSAVANGLSTQPQSAERDEAIAFFRDTAGRSGAYGGHDFNKKRFNPLGVCRTWLEVGRVDDVITYVTDLAGLLIVPDPNSKTVHFDQIAVSGLRDFMLICVFSDRMQRNREKYPCTLNTVFDLINDLLTFPEKTSMLFEEIDENTVLKNLRVGVWLRDHAMGTEERKNTFSNIRKHLDFIVSPGTRDCLDAKGDEIDLRTIRSEKQSIYFVLPAERFSAFNPSIKSLMRLWLGSAIAVARINDGFNHLSPVQFICDEVGSLGRMDLLLHELATSASAGIRLCLVFQNLGQMKVYEGWDGFFNNSVAQVFIGVSPLDADTTNLVSQASGVGTLRFIKRSDSVAKSWSWSSGTQSSSGSSGEHSSYSDGSSSSHGNGESYTQTMNEEYSKRPLLNPDQVPRTVEATPIVFSLTHYPIRIQRQPYYRNPMFDNRYPFRLPAEILAKLHL